MRIIGIPIHILNWVLITTSTGLAWATYAYFSPQKTGITLVDNTSDMFLAVAILLSICFISLTLLTFIYTLRFKDMTTISSSLFFLIWILMATATAVAWVSDTGVIPSNLTLQYDYSLPTAIMTSIALFFYSIYFILELYPFIRRMEIDNNKTKKVSKKVSGKGKKVSGKGKK